ncbi:hypothetical protein [Segatella maculosa]|uniref:hypothetical protein n=1 Tax=Segatella maculosa TaxID=439703 RepID=UPI00249341A7|nr:hypothetical protein [Segatella maculosa]
MRKGTACRQGKVYRTDQDGYGTPTTRGTVHLWRSVRRTDGGRYGTPMVKGTIHP